MPLLPTLDQAAGQLRSGRITPLDLVDGCLRRIDQLEDQVHAWVLVDAEGARRAAKQAGAEIAAGRSKGPLHGIPLSIKDIIDVAGWPTKAGSTLRKHHVATRDARVVARLRAAGAILLGKTVTTEFASFDPSPTRNPWNLARTPGGSSSGPAAAVATGMCLGAIGSQTGGSITRPASYCGVAGCKPTYGLVSLDGIVPLAFHMDHPGPIARSVADLAILLEAIAEPSGVSPAASDPAPDYLAQLDAGHPPRLGLLFDFFVERAEPAIRQAFDAAMEQLRGAGASVSRASLPRGFEQVHELHRRIMAVEALEVQRGVFPDRRECFGPRISQLLDEALATPLIDYVAALRHQQQYQHDVLELFVAADFVIMPATTSTAPDMASTGDPAFNSPWSYSGLPVVSIPCGIAGDGMPAAIQLVGPPLSEPALLAAAAWCERVLGFEAAPAIIPTT